MARPKITPSATLWFGNDELALYVVAQLALGKEPGLPIKDEALAIHRKLKAAVQRHQLIATLGPSGRPDLMSTVTRSDLRAYATTIRDQLLLRLCDRWDAQQRLSPEAAVRTQARLGRRPENDWDAFWREVVRFANVDGLPQTISDLTKQMVDWASVNWPEPPDQKHIRAKLAPLYPATRASNKR
jgi:hypothetical protein